MASVKALCTSSIVLEDGQIKFNGSTEKGIHYYQKNNLKVAEPHIRWADAEAPGNDQVKILSFAAQPLEGKILNIDSGVKLTFDIFNNTPNVNLDTTIEVVTKDHVVVFHQGLHLSEKKDSKIGTYSISLNIPPFLLNANIYSVNIIIGENQRYVLYKKNNIFSFEISNTNTGQGSNFSKLPGVIRPALAWDIDFHSTSN
jgi:lipopolysaccharide transport system ATP-binding protein